MIHHIKSSKKPTVCVGIPAYNEELSIGNLLNDLKAQQTPDVFNMNVVVISDASSDDTARLVKKTQLPNLKFIANKKRQGKAKILNKLFKICNDDILVIFDADVRLLDTDALYQLVSPVMKDKCDLVAGRVLELKPENYLQKILACSMELKREIFEEMRNGDNLYTCHGRIRAFSKRLYKNMRIPAISSEDAFSYLYVKSSGYTYMFTKNATVSYRLPATLADHLRQSQRYFNHDSSLSPYFAPQLLKREYALPLYLTIKKVFKYACLFPQYLIPYLVILLFTKVLPRHTENESTTWLIAASSKDTA